jgi:hypothetical protein
MSFIWRGGNTLNGLTGFVSIGVLLGILVGLTALPISGCSQSASQSSADEMTISEGIGSSMKIQGTVPSGSSTSDAAVATVPAAPDAKAADAVSAATVPAPGIPRVTSPTTLSLAVAAPTSPSPVAPAKLAQASLPATAVAASTSPATVDVASTSPVLKGLNGNGMEGAAQTLNPAMMRALKEFQVASASFPDFCRDWARKLSVREHDNLGNIKWAVHDGVETGSYVGYGSIDSCTCKQASNGVAVGILTYKEFDYTLTGKSVEEAKHTTPHATTVVPTREIFAYEKGKWFW